MPSDYDATEFIDGDFEGRPSAHSVGSAGAAQLRAPTREEVDSKVAETQQKLAEEELERERIALEETRRRQLEFQTGRQEMIQNLSRGVGLLAESEFAARRDAEQMSKALVGLRDALSKIQAIQEESWTKDNFSLELTRALTTLENARMEWNGARLKFEVLSSAPAQTQNASPAVHEPQAASVLNRGFGELCRLGFALTWPVAAVLLLGFILLLVMQLRR
jgi:hypothetical protein